MRQEDWSNGWNIIRRLLPNYKGWRNLAIQRTTLFCSTAVLFMCFITNIQKTKFYVSAPHEIWKLSINKIGTMSIPPLYMLQAKLKFVPSTGRKCKNRFCKMSIQIIIPIYWYLILGYFDIIKGKTFHPSHSTDGSHPPHFHTGSTFKK